MFHGTASPSPFSASLEEIIKDGKYTTDDKVYLNIQDALLHIRKSLSSQEPSFLNKINETNVFKERGYAMERYLEDGPFCPKGGEKEFYIMPVRALPNILSRRLEGDLKDERMVSLLGQGGPALAVALAAFIHPYAGAFALGGALYHYIKNPIVLPPIPKNIPDMVGIGVEVERLHQRIAEYNKGTVSRGSRNFDGFMEKISRSPKEEFTNAFFHDAQVVVYKKTADPKPAMV